VGGRRLNLKHRSIEREPRRLPLLPQQRQAKQIEKSPRRHGLSLAQGFSARPPGLGDGRRRHLMSGLRPLPQLSFSEGVKKCESHRQDRPEGLLLCGLGGLCERIKRNRQPTTPSHAKDAKTAKGNLPVCFARDRRPGADFLGLLTVAALCCLGLACPT